MRIRNKNIPFRVTEKELEIIDRKAAKAKLSRTDFLVAAALGKPINICEDLQPVLRSLSRIGNNLNQLTKKVNAGVIAAPDLGECREALGEIYTALHALILGRREEKHADSEADTL